MAEPTPWELLSPNGIWHIVDDLAALDKLADEQFPKVKRSNFHQLIGQNKNSSAGLPQHKANWQLRKKVKWIERRECEYGPAVPPTPLAGGVGKDWAENFHDVHNDTRLDGAKLHAVAFKSFYWWGTKKVEEHRGWRRVSPPAELPADAVVGGQRQQVSSCLCPRRVAPRARPARRVIVSARPCECSDAV